MEYQSESIDQLAAAVANVQAELEPAAKNSENPHVKKRYADIAAVYAAIKEVMPKHGIAVVQTMMPDEANYARVRTTLMHKSGQWIAGECRMPCDRQGGVQGMGSAITYARRYSLSAMVGVVSEDDDDGIGAMPRRQSEPARQSRAPQQTESRPQAVSKAQLQKLQILFKEIGITEREPRMKYVNEWLVINTNRGSEVASCSELSVSEASGLIEHLTKQKEPAHA